MVIFAVLVLCVVTLTGLAVDTGNLYSAKIGVQAAADAGALAGASLNALGRPQSEVEQGALDVAMMNLQLKGIRTTEDPVVTFDPSDGIKIHVDINATVDMYILANLPTVGVPFQVVTGSATAEVNPAAISLMLDISESMACPSVSAPDEPSCGCAPNCDQTDLNSRLSALKLAVLGDSTDPQNPGFLSFFDEQRDAIGLILFGTGAKTMVPMRRGGGFSYAEISTAIRNATAQGATNHADALYQAYFDTKDALFLDEASFLLFTDGAPTAARFFFTEGLRRNNDVRIEATRMTPPAMEGTEWQDVAEYDYLSWGAVLNGVHLPNETYFYPPYDDQQNNGYWEPLELSHVDAKRPPAWIVNPAFDSKGLQSAAGYKPSENLDTNAPWTGLANVAPRGMEVYMPDKSIRRLGFEDRWTAGGYQWNLWEEGEHLKLYSDIALAISDVIREQGNIFYGVGYGQPAPAGFDPYQNAMDPTKRKDYLMNRITVDPCALAEFNPPFPGEGVKELHDLAAGGISTGSYYPAATPEQMQDVFMRIARKIKMRMVR